MGCVQLVHSFSVNFLASESAMNSQSCLLCPLAQASSTTTVPHQSPCWFSTSNLTSFSPGPGRSSLHAMQKSHFQVKNCSIGIRELRSLRRRVNSVCGSLRRGQRARRPQASIPVLFLPCSQPSQPLHCWSTFQARSRYVGL